MEHAKSFRDLIVHQKARGIARRVFVLSHTFPKEERFALTDQARRASRSIGAQIADLFCSAPSCQAKEDVAQYNADTPPPPDHRFPITAHCPLTTDHRPPPTTHYPPTTDY